MPRLCWTPIIFAACLTFAAVLGGEEPLPPRSAAKQGERLREGTALVEAAGSFQFAGDRIAFQPDGASDSLRVLENLALERVGRIIAEGRGAQAWVVSGQITEYKGANYLLLTKAVVRLPGLDAKPRQAATPDRTTVDKTAGSGHGRLQQ
jgi:hypothetical protein